jgi:5-methylcytosine-specific restriction endonuclease McrA
MEHTWHNLFSVLDDPLRHWRNRPNQENIQAISFNHIICNVKLDIYQMVGRCIARFYIIPWSLLGILLHDFRHKTPHIYVKLEININKGINE